MTGMLRVVMNACGIYDFGVCKFEAVEDNIIDCMAKGRLPKSPKSVIAALFPYNTGIEFGKKSMFDSMSMFNEIAGRMLSTATNALIEMFGDYKFVWFMNPSPISGVHAAAASGLGVVGDNGLLITPRFGTYLLIGTIVSDLEMPIDGRKIETCEHCGECLKSCPAIKMLSPDEQLAGLNPYLCLNHPKEDSSVCIPRHGGLVYGCNKCQEACPHNKHALGTYILPFLDYVNPDKTINDLASANHQRYLARSFEAASRTIRALNDDMELSSQF